MRILQTYVGSVLRIAKDNECLFVAEVIIREGHRTDFQSYNPRSDNIPRTDQKSTAYQHLQRAPLSRMREVIKRYGVWPGPECPIRSYVHNTDAVKMAI